jgi:hypothetical protein
LGANSNILDQVILAVGQPDAVHLFGHQAAGRRRDSSRQHLTIAKSASVMISLLAKIQLATSVMHLGGFLPFSNQ